MVKTILGGNYICIKIKFYTRWDKGYCIGNQIMKNLILISDILKIYETGNNILVEIPSKYIIKNDNDYKNYPNYLDGKYYEKEEKSYFEFSMSKIELQKV
ncbi:hypothetical protein [uncultured Chryseobacterium sp.]|uniref:hypothetical protein n=1 Tax=uncultured Chryseobacterium sp. TaxID=259322 RepID=UPI0025841E2E|nr:hypothetical protein [uncultured Chryseobacterium sp.]